MRRERRLTGIIWCGFLTLLLVLGTGRAAHASEMPKAMTAKGKNALVIRWSKTEGAEGYDIFFSEYSKKKCRKVRTIEGNGTFSWTKKDLKPNTLYKARVKAWIRKDGSKKYTGTGPMVYAYTSNGTEQYTNAKSIKVREEKMFLMPGETGKIDAKISKADENKMLLPETYTEQLRFMSSNKKVATVTKSGKIKAGSTGNCKVCVYAANGVCKIIKVIVGSVGDTAVRNPSSYSSYLKSTTNCQVNNSNIKNLVDSITKGLTGDKSKATALFCYVRDCISYSFYYNTRYGAVDTLNAKEGNDIDQAHLLIAMLRAAGIPARYCHGTCKFTDGSIYDHVWVECLINEAGSEEWITLDPTDTHNSYGLIQNWDTQNVSFKGRYASLSF